MDYLPEVHPARYEGFLLEVDYDKHHYLVRCLIPSHHFPTAYLGDKPDQVLKTVRAYSEAITNSGKEVLVRLTKRARQINPDLASSLGIE